MTASALDDVPGLGPTRKKRLLKEFGSVKRLRTLEEQELTALSWLPDPVAKAVYQKLHPLERATMGADSGDGGRGVGAWSRPMDDPPS
jgi:excinuclease ABC subunit C